ncbi:hypothetical protein IKG28_02320 [Candidatus Saccharibacteria bacterium]|nr:hypothetical protein [Candidatus Saccharibacteria bacterium]
MAKKTKVEYSPSQIVESEYYYENLMSMLDTIKKFKHTVDTYRNLHIPENAHEVEEDFQSTYGGSEERLLGAHKNFLKRSRKEIASFNEVCHDCGIEEIHNPDNLIKNLLVNGRITKIKKLIKKHRKNCKVLSVQELYAELGSQK